MKNILLNFLRVIIILISAAITVFATVDGWRTFGVLVATIVFKNFFTSQVYDPIFQHESAQRWVFRVLKKWTTRKRSTQDFDI